MPTTSPDNPQPNPTTTLSGHTVQEGETLAGIAQTYGVSLNELIVANALANPDLLYVGQRLVLPPSTAIQPTPEPSSTPAASAPIPSLASPDQIIAGRWIDVDITEQRLTAYDGSTPVHTTLVSTGLPYTPTPVGRFRIWIKLRFEDMAGADYYIEDVPYVMYFHEGYGLHGVTWHGNFGHPMSHGCVNLPTSEAEWLYNWAKVGTLVNVHE
jgi:lipoprotein-anchoring transpeptidase ErfK/SrfK